MQAWIVDTFVDQNFAGNDAAVILLQNEFPHTDEMQSIALDLGVPTTAFMLAPRESSRYPIRWFTPRKELNLCGHATVASACFLYDVKGVCRSTELCFETHSGPLHARRIGSSISLDLPRMDVTACDLPDGLEDALGAKIVNCNRAIDDILVELESEEAVATLRPKFDVLAGINCRGHIVTAQAATQNADFVSRSFFPALGVDEDQVCVSAHCKLGPFWGERLQKEQLTAIQMSQRGGRLMIEVDDHRVQVAGNAHARACVDQARRNGSRSAGHKWERHSAKTGMAAAAYRIHASRTSKDRSDIAACPVNSHNEWDPLEEVIVGIVEGARFPPWHVSVQAPLPHDQYALFRANAGKSFPAERIRSASAELDELAHILEAEGVTVRRPEPRDHLLSYGAPGWESTGLYDAMPRDVLLVLGDEILECPLAWRSRYFGTSAFRPLLKEYFRGGARWSAGPKPELPDEFYDNDWAEPRQGETPRFAINEFEPTFDAADFIRFGRDIVGQISNVTNSFGIEWLRQHLGDAYRLHVLEFNDSHPMHIDATLTPLAPGKLLVNPERVSDIPAIFKGWDIFPAPQPIIPDDHPLYMTSKWINMNLLMIDEQRVIVERQDEPMIAALAGWGFTPIPCNFRNFNSFGGSFHCATLDVRRRGTLQSYF